MNDSTKIADRARRTRRQMYALRISSDETRMAIARQAARRKQTPEEFLEDFLTEYARDEWEA